MNKLIINVGNEVAWAGQVLVCTTATTSGKRGFVFEVKGHPKHPLNTFYFSEKEIKFCLENNEMKVLK